MLMYRSWPIESTMVNFKTSWRIGCFNQPLTLLQKALDANRTLKTPEVSDSFDQ